MNACMWWSYLSPWHLLVGLQLFLGVCGISGRTPLASLGSACHPAHGRISICNGCGALRGFCCARSRHNLGCGENSFVCPSCLCIGLASERLVMKHTSTQQDHLGSLREGLLGKVGRDAEDSCTVALADTTRKGHAHPYAQVDNIKRATHTLRTASRSRREHNAASVGHADELTSVGEEVLPIPPRNVWRSRA
jgi:hypothetical protein